MTYFKNKITSFIGGMNADIYDFKTLRNAGDLYKQDMYSPVTRNESKLILVDLPNIPNKDIFISPIK